MEKPDGCRREFTLARTLDDQLEIGAANAFVL
jgi:hypothetical protein